MLIPFGVFSAAGAGGGASVPAFELISTAYGTGSSGVITFSSIPSTYKHLQLRIVSKNSTTGSTIWMVFNGDTTSGYVYHYLNSSGTSAVSSTSGSGNPRVQLEWSMAVSTTTSAHRASIVDILDYASTVKNKTTRALSGGPDATNTVGLQSGLWPSTAAINSITLTANTGNYNAASRFSLYGIKE